MLFWQLFRYDVHVICLPYKLKVTEPLNLQQLGRVLHIPYTYKLQVWHSEPLYYDNQLCTVMTLDDNCFVDISHETADQLLDFVERYVMTRLYRTVFCPPTSDDEDRDLAIQDRIRSLHWINTFLLDIALNETDDSMRKLVDQAITGIPCYSYVLLVYCVTEVFALQTVLLRYCFTRNSSCLFLHFSFLHLMLIICLFELNTNEIAIIILF